MTTLNDINVLRQVYEEYAERYNRRCRRLTVLYLSGRKMTDHIIKVRTDERRLGYESTKKDLETAIETQAMLASLKD